MSNSEFKHLTKKDWLEKVEKDLKGKPTESLNWKVADDIEISPFASYQDILGIDHSILKEYNPDWQIGEYFEVIDPKETNKQVLKALMNGLDAPVFRFNNMPSEADFLAVFKDVMVEFISTHFSLAKEIDPVQFHDLWIKLVEGRGLTSTFSCFDFKAETDDQLDALKDIVAHNPDYSAETIHVDCRDLYSGDQNIKNEIHQAISRARFYFEEMMARGLDAPLIANQMYFTFAIGKSYLLEVAKLRAFKLLWIDLLNELDMEAALPFVCVESAPETYTGSEHDDLINASSMAMSAIAGGANHLIIKPTAETESAKVYARNIQLILKHESGFNKESDPMQGSYYIEQLTAQLTK